MVARNQVETVLTADGYITITQGDAPTLTLYAIDGSGNPINLTGATFSTQILGTNGVGPITFGNSQHAIVNAADGEFTLALASTDTPNLGIGPNKDILTQITIAGKATYYWGRGILQVMPATPLQ
jgi:hypothetical protein